MVTGIAPRAANRRTGRFAVGALLVMLPGSSVVRAEGVGTLRITNATLVAGTIETFRPTATKANLKGPGWVVGNTLWDNDGDGLFQLEKRVGFAWSEATGMLPSEVSARDFEGLFIHRPIDVNPNGAHVGYITYRDTIDQVPYLFRPQAGFVRLPLPRTPGRPNLLVPSVGFARAISDDGRTVVGAVLDGPFSDSPSHATTWSTRARRIRARVRRIELPTADPFSNAWEVNADGTVIVGDSGADPALPVATRWVNRIQQPLETVGTSSSARLVSADGSISVGWAEFGGLDFLVHWDSDGNATVAEPPAGSRIESLRAITPDGTAVCGILSSDDFTTPFGENWAPFVWSNDEGFVVISENGREADYDVSETFDISDDGNTVVGWLHSSIVFNGDPPTLGFVWTRKDGLLLINDILAQSGLAAPTFVYKAFSVSGDGLRIVGHGDAIGTLFDTNTYVLDLQRQ